jgi:hypothetical protein
MACHPIGVTNLCADCVDAVRMSLVSPAVTSPRAPIVTIAKGLPDVGVAFLARVTRMSLRGGRAVVQAGGATLDVIARPAPVQAFLQGVAASLQPAQVRGAATREVEVQRVRVLAQDATVAISRVGVRIIEELPLDDLLTHIDLNAILAHVDIDAMLQHVNIDAMLREIDINAMLEGVDLDAMMTRIDVDAILARVDVDAMLSRVDIERVARDAINGIDLGPMIRDSTTGVAAEARDAARLGAMNADILVGRIVDVILRRKQKRHEAEAIVGTDRTVVTAE